MTLEEEIITEIEDVAALAGGATGWFLAGGYVPDSPDRVVAVTEYQGRAPGTNIDMDRPRFQVRVRAEEGARREAREKLQAVFDHFHTMTKTLSGRYYVAIMAVAGAQPLGFDDNNRPEWVQNFQALRSR